MAYVGKSREELLRKDTKDLKAEVTKDAWVSLKQYFDGRGNGPEAKVACVVIATVAKEAQSTNNERALQMMEARFKAKGLLK